MEGEMNLQAIIGIVQGILDDLETLMRQQTNLLRDELKLEISKASRVAVSLATGIGLVAIGGLFFLLMLVYALHEGMSLPLWSCYGIVAGVLIILAIVFVLRARSLAQHVHAIPQRTLFAVRENFQWIKEHAMSKRI